MENTALAINEEGKDAFQKGDFEKAISLFQQAADAHLKAENPLDAAEAQNNLSVALLQVDRAEESLKAAEGTDKIFEEAGDVLRQAMALGNQASALDALGKAEEAIALYQQSVQLFDQIGEADLKATVLKSIAAIKLRKGKIQDSAIDMLDSLGATPKPTFFQRILKFFLRLIR